MAIGNKLSSLKKPVLIDASSAIILFKSGLFDHLLNNYAVCMTPTVFCEITRDGYPGADRFNELHDKHRFRITDSDSAASLRRTGLPGLTSLGPGERETIQEFLCGRAEFIIVDDGRAGGYCRNRKIPFINALLLPRVLNMAGRLSEHLCRSVTEAIMRHGRYSADIIAKAERLDKNALVYFLP